MRTSASHVWHVECPNNPALACFVRNYETGECFQTYNAEALALYLNQTDDYIQELRAETRHTIAGE